MPFLAMFTNNVMVELPKCAIYMTLTQLKFYQQINARSLETAIFTKVNYSDYRFHLYKVTDVETP